MTEERTYPTTKVLKTLIQEAIKPVIKERYTAEDLIEKIESAIMDSFHPYPRAGVIESGAFIIGTLRFEDFRYFSTIAKNTFQTPLNFNDIENVDCIFETMFGWLVVSDVNEGVGTEAYDEVYYARWYPVGYEYVSIKKNKDHWEDGSFSFEIVETEEFKTPMFRLHPEKIIPYCVRMGRNGYMLMQEFEYRDFGWKYDHDSHDLDFVKEVTGADTVEGQ